MVFWQLPSPAPPEPAPVCGAGLSSVMRPAFVQTGEKKNVKLNIDIENGIFLRFLVVCSVPGNCGPGLGVFLTFLCHSVVFSITFLLLCFESKRQNF